MRIAHDCQIMLACICVPELKLMWGACSLKGHMSCQQVHASSSAGDAITL